MVDNTTLPVPQTQGDSIACDDIGGVKFQRVKLVHGADGVNSGDISTTNPFHVTSVIDAAIKEALRKFEEYKAKKRRRNELAIMLLLN